jgi:hypothetical protein
MTLVQRYVPDAASRSLHAASKALVSASCRRRHRERARSYTEPNPHFSPGGEATR